MTHLSDSSSDTNHSSKLDTKKLDNSPQTYSLQSQTVSANKFDQSLREIDGSVAVASQKKLQDLQINSTKDLGKIFPGFVLKSQTSSRSFVSSVRGISTTDTYNPSIVVYVDGVPQDSAFLAQEFLNVQRVELLRGPQGTIWGQNAQAGVLNIISNPIDNNTPRLNASTSIGTLYKNTMLSASTPLVNDWLYIGGSLSYNRFSGQIKNSAPSNDARNQKQDTSDSLSGTANIAFAPKNSGFQALFKYSKNNLTDHHMGFFLNKDEYNKLKVGQDHSYPLEKTDVSTYALKLSYDFGASSLSNVTSFQESDMESYVTYRPSGLFDHAETTTNELRLNTQYDNGAYSIFGLYYQNVDFRIPGMYGLKVNKQDISVYGEGKVPLWYDFDATLGMRYAYDTSSRKQNSSNEKNSYDSHFFTPKVALGYDVNEDIRLYLLYALGYKPGGFDFFSGNKLKPENTQNVELGIHAGFWGNKISLDASLYYIYIIDKQVYIGYGRDSALKNSGRVDSKGVELSLALQPIERLRFSFGGTFGQSRYVKYYDSYKKEDYSGNMLSFSPDITMNANLDWEFLDIKQMKLFFSPSVSFYSKTYFDEYNTLSQKPYALVDLSLRVEAQKHLSINFYIHNTFNQKYLNYLVPLKTGSGHLLGDLQNIGMSLSYRY